jgi:hypothetical protein
MKEQVFSVRVKVVAKVESGGKPYLTEARVKKQIEKFLRQSITEGLPCNGTGTITVTEVIEG